MAFTQHVMAYPDWLAAGGWTPSADVAVADDWVVNACVTDADVVDDGVIVHPAGSVVWANFWPPNVDPAGAINPDVAALDWRA